MSETLSKPLTKWRKCGDLEDLRRRAWRSVKAAERVMYDEQSTRAEVLKAATVLQQSVRTYLKVLEADELEERIAALEDAFEERQSGSTTNGALHYN